MTARVYVTGIGIISAVGANVDENLTSIRSLTTGQGEITHLSTINKGIYPVCEIKQNNSELKTLANTGDCPEASRTSLLGLIAATEASNYAGLTSKDLIGTGLISANSVGGIDRSEIFYPDFLHNPQKGRLRDVWSHESGHSTEFIASRLGTAAFVSTISTACSSSANAIMFGARLIKSGRVERVIAGGCDALTKFTVNGFASLKILDKNACKPFDENRNGLNLGEGAGYLVLESEKAVSSRNAKPICCISGYGNTCDAYHQTASSPDGEGSFQAMAVALETAGLSASDINYINAHGTGTGNNDLSEGTAIQRLFSDTIPPVSSTKPFTGHTLGAAGGIEAVLCCLAIQDGIIYPNLNWQTPMKELGFQPNEDLLENKVLHNILSNSFGFGGNDTSLIFSGC